jgi:hypothetical protein
VKVRLDLTSPVLLRALTDLLTAAGHRVEPAASRALDLRLQILAEPGAGFVAPKVPVLYLRPGRGLRADEDPMRALADALRDGGAAVWASPLDPRALLGALGPEAATGSPRTERSGVEAPALISREPWILLDPRTRRVLWSNEAARARFVLPGGDRLSERGTTAIPAGAFDRTDGHEMRSVEGRPTLVVWWTDEMDRRCVGLMRLSGRPATEGPGNVETLSELGRVSATLAHEIRNPLASFAGALDLLDADLDATDRSQIIALARARLTQMRTMLDDALRLARPFKDAPEPVALDEVVRSAVASVRGDPGFANVDVRIEAATPPSPTVLAHPVPLRQALVNLLVNAAQAQQGSGRVTVRTEAGDLCGVLRVQDEGPGIPKELREKVFALFWTTKSTGTGLGLAFVKRVAEAAGGRVLVEDAPRGACIRLELPTAERP